MAASGERKGGGDPLPKEQKGGGDRGILSKLTGLLPDFGTPTEDYNFPVALRNETGSDWLEVVENVSKWSVSKLG